MKKIITIIMSIVFLGAMPFSATNAQEKKIEKKIKIVVSDGPGTEIILDTLIKDSEINDSIIVKGGKTVFIRHSGDEKVIKHSGDAENVYVYVSSDDKEESKDAKTISVVSSGSGTHIEKGNNTKVIVMNKDLKSAGNSNTHYSIITTDSDGESNPDSTDELTRSIIAKDGMVVTVEGKDEEKVNELVKEIQNKMGVKSPSDNTKSTEKAETKKSTKK
jgi:hypothetical protein